MAKMKASDQLVTKGMLDKKLDDVVDTILGGMDNIQASNNKRFDKVEKRLGNLEADMTFVKRDISDIKVATSDIPTRQEFNKLKLQMAN